MGAGMIIAIVIFVALIGGGIFAYMKKWFWFQKSTGARTYNTVYSSKKVKGACDPATGGTAVAASKSSDCAAACDAVKAPSVCNGYDWDGSSGCTLYATLPSKATAPTSKTDKNECRALSSTK